MTRQYTSRVAEQTVKRFLKAFPVVGITGPRQSGKSTLLKHLLNDYEYVTFDDLRNIQLFEDDPVGFLERYSDQVIFDEVQLVPELFSAIKLAVDQDRGRYGKFVLTGSSQFAFLKSASESLAGRMGLISLLPFQREEVPKKSHKESIYSGAYPELVLRKYHEADLWYSSYIDTYLNKDLRSLANVGDIREFRRFVQLLASNVGQTLDMSHYARDLGVATSTIKRWISILEASYVLFLVPPYSSNLSKRIVKSPKLYFFDTGLVSYFTGIQTYDQYDRGPLGGPLFENYVVSEIYKKLLHTASRSELYYLRTYDKQEVDLIIDHQTSKDLIEIKKSSTFKPGMLKWLNLFRSKEDQAYMIYQGKDDTYSKVQILNLDSFLKRI